MPLLPFFQVVAVSRPVRQEMSTREALFALSVLSIPSTEESKLVFYRWCKSIWLNQAHHTIRTVGKKRCRCSRSKNHTESLWTASESENTQISIVPIRSGVRQWCVLSPMLFSMYSEVTFQNMDEAEDGKKVNGKLTNKICRRHSDNRSQSWKAAMRNRKHIDFR